MKSVMSHQGIGVLGKARSGLAIFRSFRAGDLGDAEGVLAFHRELRGVARNYVQKETNELSVLDVGCGPLVSGHESNSCN